MKEVPMSFIKTTKGTVVYGNVNSTICQSIYLKKEAWPDGKYPPAITLSIKEEKNV